MKKAHNFEIIKEFMTLRADAWSRWTKHGRQMQSVKVAVVSWSFNPKDIGRLPNQMLPPIDA